MQDFYSEVSHEVRRPKALNNNLNKFLLIQIEKTGVELAKFKMKNQQIAAARKNPITRLYEAKRLTRKEYAAATNYQNRFEISQISHHSRPSYDGTTISAASSQLGEGGPSQSQIDADRFVFKIKQQLKLKCNFETRFLHGKFVIVDFKLNEILEAIFEKQIAVRNARSLLSLDDRVIEDRIKKICKVLLAN